MQSLYTCPVYKTRQRGVTFSPVLYLDIYLDTFLGPTYVWAFNLKSKEKSSKWVLAGVALLLQI